MDNSLKKNVFLQNIVVDFWRQTPKEAKEAIIKWKSGKKRKKFFIECGLVQKIAASKKYPTEIVFSHRDFEKLIIGQLNRVPDDHITEISALLASYYFEKLENPVIAQLNKDFLDVYPEFKDFNKIIDFFQTAFTNNLDKINPKLLKVVLCNFLLNYPVFETLVDDDVKRIEEIFSNAFSSLQRSEPTLANENPIKQISDELQKIKDLLASVIEKYQSNIIPNEDFSELNTVYTKVKDLIHDICEETEFKDGLKFVSPSEINWIGFSEEYQKFLTTKSTSEGKMQSILSSLHAIAEFLIKGGVSKKDVADLIISKIDFTNISTLEFDPDTLPPSIILLLDFGDGKYSGLSHAKDYLDALIFLRQEFSDTIGYCLANLKLETVANMDRPSIEQTKSFILDLIGSEIQVPMENSISGDKESVDVKVNQEIIVEDIGVSTSLDDSCGDGDSDVVFNISDNDIRTVIPISNVQDADLPSSELIDELPNHSGINEGTEAFETLPELSTYVESTDLYQTILHHSIIEDSTKCAEGSHYGRVIFFIEKLNCDLPESKKFLPRWIFEAIFYSQYYDEFNDELKVILKKRLNNDYFEIFAENNGEWNSCIRLLLFSASALSSLTIPDSNGINIIRELRFKEDFTELAQLCKIFVDFANGGNILDQHRLEIIVKGKTNDEMSDDLRDKARDIKNHNQQKVLSYVPARKVLSELMSKDGEISVLLDAVINGRGGLTADLFRIASIYSDPVEAAKRINLISSRINNSHIEIKNFSLDHLVRELKLSADIALKWHNLVTSNRSTSDAFTTEKIMNFIDNFSSMRPKIESKLISKLGASNTPLMELSARSALLILNKIQTILDGHFGANHDNVPIPNLDFLFLNPKTIMKVRGGDSLVKSLEMDSARLLQLIHNDRNGLSTEVYEQLRQSPLGIAALEVAANNQMRLGFFEYAEYLCKYSEVSVDLKNKYADSIRKARLQLSQSIIETNDLIESAVIDNLLFESEREDYQGFVSSISPESELNIFQRVVELKNIHSQIATKRSERSEILKKKIESLSVEKSLKDDLIEKLRKGQFETVTSHVELLEKGDRNFDLIERQSAYSEYQAVSDIIEKNLVDSNRTIQTKIQNLERGSKFMGIQMSSEGPRFRDSRQLLMNWFRVKEDKKITDKSLNLLKEILVLLHFDVRDIRLEDRPQAQAFQAITFNTNSIPKSPIPAFGSESRGFFNLICFWERPSELEIINVLNSRASRGATILFYFARFDKGKKKALFKAWHSHKKTVLAIDDILLTFIASKLELSPEILFECALPNTFNNPFHTVAGKVPQEIFFGRKEEIDSLVNPMGSCIIYGGRQLGKTAILKSIESQYHSPKTGQIVIYIDLKVHGFGMIRTSSDPIFDVIGVECQKHGILNSGESKKEEKIINGIRNWLMEVQTRRILLLMDEADLFIELDAENSLKAIEKLKGLMDSTNSQFKFVISGLHNVERFTMLSNSTIAHLKTRGVYCIGPLINNGEHLAAKQMIIKPFHHLGFEFEDQESIYRILGYTNYYPSLIQLFGHYLMLDLNEWVKRQSDLKIGIPIKISKEMIDHVYLKGGKLKNEIIDRFQWTLNLDTRYELLALIIALECMENKEIISKGLSLKTILSLAQYWDEKKIFVGGLPDRDMVYDLLTEMIGLGIIRIVEDGNFTLKNSNILRLLGNKRQIEDRLVLINTNTENRVLDISTARRLHSSKSTICPFTARQEEIILKVENSVVLICGSVALGINDVVEYLRVSIQDYPQYNKPDFIKYDPTTVNLHESQLENFILGKQEKAEIMVFDFTEILNESLIESCLTLMRRRSSQAQIKKIVFVISDYYSNGFRRDLVSEGSLSRQIRLDLVTLKKISQSMLSNWANHVMNKQIDSFKGELGYWTGLYNIILEENIDKAQQDLLSELQLKQKDIFAINSPIIKLFLKDITAFDCEFTYANITEMIESMELTPKELYSCWEICIEREYFEKSTSSSGDLVYRVDPIISKYINNNS